MSPCGDFTILVADWSISSYVVKVVWRILVPWSGAGGGTAVFASKNSLLPCRGVGKNRPGRGRGSRAPQREGLRTFDIDTGLIGVLTIQASPK